MRRFIDVVFIHPKNRYYVVLHQGKFWQLARMNLTVSSWVFKLLYKGSLGDIFVARNQAVVDEKLSKILKTYELPAELHGLNANRFLDWWEMNDYKWLSTKDVLTLDAKPKPQTLSLPQAQAPSPKQNPPTSDGIATPATPDNKTNDRADNAGTATDRTAPNLQSSVPVVPSPATQETTQANQPRPSPNLTQTQPKKANEPSGFDVFDSLLHELNEEILHPKP